MTSRVRDNALSLLDMVGITEPPIDVNRIAEALGFQVMPHPFPEKLKGMVQIEGDTKVIGVNSNYSEAAQRFTVGHELGHYLCGHEHIENTFIDDERRFYEPYFHTEKEADAFAGELLMPKHMLEKDLNEHGPDIAWLKERYQVSEQALWIRLTSLRLTDKYSHVKLKAENS